MTVDKLDIIERLKTDREGLIKQGNELQKQLLMVKGALQYVNQIIEEDNHGK